MEIKRIYRAGIRQHRGVLCGILILNFFVVLALGTLVTVRENSARYVHSELNRLGYGDVTVWVSEKSGESIQNLPEQIQKLSEVKEAKGLPLIFSDYETKEQESDSEGQLIVYEKSQGYHFFDEKMTGYLKEKDLPEIQNGEVYVSPSLVSVFGTKIGDEITFKIARNSGNFTLRVKGFYEDPMMGSSMIGMKGFLISEKDYEKIKEIIGRSGIDALARNGQMIHIKAADSSLDDAKLLQSIERQIPLSKVFEFSHSQAVIEGFMMVLQNAFSGFLLAFVVVLFLVVLLVLGHAIRSGIEADYKNIGILKTLGITGAKIRKIQVLQYMTGVLPGMLLGSLGIPFCAGYLLQMTVTSSGIKIPVRIPVLWILIILTGLCMIIVVFVWRKTKKVIEVTPMNAIQGELNAGNTSGLFSKTKIQGKYLQFSIAFRQVTSGYRKYISICLIAVLLVFFAQTVGRMNSWLGSDGQGMMDAFNPADHDIGVQMFGKNTDEDAKNIILSYTGITDSYELAMPDVTIDGTGYTANVITDPERFHMLSGDTCMSDDEVVITEFLAKDYKVAVGDMLTVTGDAGSGNYRISGIYSCANDMGANIGMSREGYLKIGKDDRRIWCHHYFLADPDLKYQITDALEKRFGGDVHVHENTWPGLLGIITAMHALIAGMYALILVFILITTILTGTRLLRDEKSDFGIYKALGYPGEKLQLSFAIRFGIVAFVGSVIGTVLSILFADPLISQVMKLEGISNFAASPSILTLVVPGMIVTVLFFGFAYVIGRRIRKESSVGVIG